MALLTRGYTCYARLWANSDDLTLIRWFPADPGARCFTGRHRFDTLYDRRGPSSRDIPGTPDPYRAGEGIDNTGVGEAGTGFSTPELPRVTSDLGNIHGLVGAAACRPDLFFTGGTYGVDPILPVDADGVPLCCKRAEQPKGGLALGGRALEGAVAGPERPSGGVMLGGEALEAVLGVEVAKGGLALGGEALEAAAAGERPLGGLALGGRGIEAGLAGELALGGLALGGEALEGAAAGEVGLGGLALGGEALEAAGAAELPLGGLALGGEALEAASAAELALGGLALGGRGIEAGLAGESGLGGLALGGEAFEAVAFDWLSNLVNAEDAQVNPSAYSISYSKWTKVKATVASSIVLPASVSGQFVAVTMDPGGSQLLTVTLTGTQKLDGVASLILQPGESFVALADGSNFYKFMRTRIPMIGLITLTGSQSIPTGGSPTQVTVDTSKQDNTGLMVDTTGHQLKIQRGGYYHVTCYVAFAVSADFDSYIYLYKNGSQLRQADFSQRFVSQNTHGVFLHWLDVFAATDTLQLYCFQDSGSGAALITVGTANPFIQAVEVPTW